MKPVFGLQFGAFPIYALMILLGCFVGMLVFHSAVKHGGLSKDIKKRVRKSLFFGCLSGLLCSNLIHWAVMEEVAQMPVAERFTHGGFSVYFGVLGFLCVSALLLRMYRVQVRTNLNLVIIPLIVAQIIWRTGCALRGCCYGIGEEFTFPVRLLEMAGLLVLAIVLRLRKTQDKRVSIYLFSYSLLRFVLEFFRGDDRGALLGITWLTPTQLTALAVIVVSGGYLFLLPILKKSETEDGQISFITKLQGIFRRKDKAPYEPLPQDYEELMPGTHPVRIIALLTAIAILITTVFSVWNPLSWSFLDGFSDSVQSWLYDPRGRDDPIGDTTGTAIIDLSDVGQISDTETALQVVRSYDQFADVQLAPVQSVSGSDRVYVFTQTIAGKPVLGTECVLVTDYNGNALYLVSDAANRVYSQDVITAGTIETASARTTSFTKSVAAASNGGASLLDTLHYWFNTGEGLLDVYLAKSDDDATDTVIIDKATGNTLASVDADGKLNQIDRLCIKLAIYRVRLALSSEESVQKLSKKAPGDSGYTQKYNILSRALASAYIKSGLAADTFATILGNSKNVIRETSAITVDAYCEIFVAETLSYLRYQGMNTDSANQIADKIEHAFERCGIKQKDDQVATAITVRQRKSTFCYQMDFLGDRDLYVINGIPNQSTQITFSASTPIRVEISTYEGNTLTSMFVDDQWTITFAPEDGQRFVVRVLDNRDGNAKDKTSAYKLAVVSQPDPNATSDYVTEILKEVEKAYNSSSYARFGCVITNEAEHRPFFVWEIVSAGVLMPVVDSCAVSCSGQSEDYDSAKAEILRYLVIDYPDALYDDSEDSDTILNLLSKTSLELNCLSEKTIDGITYVKASIGVYMDGFYLYEGYTFLQFELFETGDNESLLQKLKALTETSDDAEKEQILEWFLMEFQRDGYYITAANQEQIAAKFGDSLSDQNSVVGLNSLYDLWETYRVSQDGLTVTLHRLDKEEALADGHSEEQINGFQEFIDAKNIADLKAYRAALEDMRSQLQAEAFITDIMFFAIDVYTGSWYSAVGGLILDKAECGWIGDIYDIATGDIDGFVDGKITDQMQGQLTASAETGIAQLTEYIKILDRWIAEYEQNGSL